MYDIIFLKYYSVSEHSIASVPHFLGIMLQVATEVENLFHTLIPTFLGCVLRNRVVRYNTFYGLMFSLKYMRRESILHYCGLYCSAASFPHAGCVSFTGAPRRGPARLPVLAPLR